MNVTEKKFNSRTKINYIQKERNDFGIIHANSIERIFFNILFRCVEMGKIQSDQIYANK